MQNYIKLNDVPLKKYNTLQLESYADVVFFPLNKNGLIEVLNQTNHLKRILIGKGSNILLKKERYESEYVFIITSMMDDIHIENDEIVCEAGASLSSLAWFAIEHSIEEGFFTYRHAKFNPNDCILSCGLKNLGGDDLENLEKVLNYKRERYRKQPRNYPNAGSVFKRPKKDGEWLFVWKLFEACGLRGKRIGGAELSFKHPGFIVNVNHASTKDVFDLIELCQKSVKDMFDVDIELEWKVIE